MFIERNEDGAITGAYAVPQVGKNLDYLEPDNPDLVKFLESITV